MDYVAVNADAALIKGMPVLGWVDSSHVMAGTRAAPCLSIAGCVARPAHFHDMTAAATLAMLSLSEVTVTFNLGYLMRCADAMEGLKMFAVPLTHTSDIDDKLIPALARLPSPSPFEIRAGEMYEANAFMVPAIAAVAQCTVLCRLSFSVTALVFRTFFGKHVTAADDGCPWRYHALGACQG